MLSVVLDFYHRTLAALELEVPLEKISNLPVTDNIVRMKEIHADIAVDSIKIILDRIRLSFAELGVE